MPTFGSDRPVASLDALPPQSESVLSDIARFLLRRPQHEALIRFDTPAKRKEFSQRVTQRLDISIEPYAARNIHKTGIDGPGGYSFEELLGWNRDSVFRSNRLACVTHLEGTRDHVRIHVFGLEKLFAFGKDGSGGIRLPALFGMDKVRVNRTPQTADVDNARSRFYECTGGYPIGKFLMYARSSIAEQQDEDAGQFSFMVAFNPD